MNRIIYSLVTVLISWVGAAEVALSHGVNLDANVHATSPNGRTVTYSPDDVPSGAQINSIEIVATYTTDEPMTGARVQVFAPDDRSTPWTTGQVDQHGRFTFTPDLSKQGRWTVRVQEADHSNFVDILIP